MKCWLGGRQDVEEEGGDGEHRVVPSEPDLVGPIPGQRVQVVYEHRHLQVPPILINLLS